MIYDYSKKGKRHALYLVTSVQIFDRAVSLESLGLPQAEWILASLILERLVEQRRSVRKDI